ncbi:MAG TPA: polysaccharide biosynthesis/export family protein [Terriglobia bacterium]|jgi:polysaccharide export outer membrane protein
MRTLYIAGLILVSSSILLSGQAQQTARPQRPPLPAPLPQNEFITNRPTNTPTSSAGQEYRVGPDDLIDITVFEAPDLGGASRVSATGSMTLPLVGPINVAGRTIREVEQSVETALKSKYVNDPHVTVFVREYASQPVSIIGSVRVPGIYQIKGEKDLYGMLAQAGGLDAEAGSTIQIIRAKSASADSEEASKPAETVSINIQDLTENGKTELNVPIRAGDTINVLRAGSIFVEGEVMRPNEFVLRNGKNVTVAQAIALANGMTKDARKKDCVVFRIHKDGSKEEIKADAGKILRGEAMDVTMLPNDILFIPASKLKPAALRALDSTIAVAMGRIIYSGL